MTQNELIALIDQAAEEGWTELDLSGKGLTKLPPEIGKLTRLEVLILGGNRQEWKQINNRWLPSLIGNELTDLPEELIQLASLSKLSLNGNPLRKIPPFIFEIHTLTDLNAEGTGIRTIPVEVEKLSNLTGLSLRGNQITEISEVVAQLPKLTNLALGGNRITEISEVVAQLPKLTNLDLLGNQITEIPSVIRQLSSLSNLNLGGNQIIQIPNVIGQLSNLTRIYLWGNQLTEIPEAITQLSKLVTLNLWGNQITEIPETIQHLTKLETLYLSSNKVVEIPEVISQLSNLTELNLQNNKITQIPETIAQLSKLTQLNLSSNQITEIPKTIKNLSNLTILDLSDNKLTKISEAVTQLSNLVELNLENNNITNTPNTLINLSQLTKLDLRNNPLSTSPEILGPSDIDQAPSTPETFFNYLQELRSGEKRQLNEAKLLLIGQGSVGKTSLVKRLLHGTYNPNESQTDGLNVTNWTIEVNTKPVRLNVWDFGGQEIYHATHQFFLTKRSLYILTCNCRTSEDENRIEYWLKLIQSFGGNSPVIIVGNKSDEQPLDINRKALKDKYPNIKAILETSCANGKGIEQLRTTITQEVAKLHDVYNLLPLTWFQVKEQLEEMDEDFITYNRYTGLCYEQKVTEEQSQDQLIDLLHNLGLVLNFRNHPILKDTNVLNPDWVTTGIYAILSDDTLKTKTKGILTTSDLDRILASDRYPAKRYPYLTELMKEFQLGFRIDSCTPAKFLIPGLLPKDEPENTNLQGDTLDFQYHYRILPESILSRFIVLTHEDIHNETYWRSGVMLHHTEGDSIENIARIKADPEDKKIFIAISGKNATRRTFLTILRKVFAKIHNSFANLTVTEWVPVPDHPDHPPIDYQELLGAEAMGDTTYTIGKLRKRINLRKLLDGYESLEARQQRRRDERGKEGRFEEEQLARSIRDINIHITNDNNNQQSQEAHQPMSNTIHQHGQGDNFAGDQVHGDKIHTQINNSTDLTQAARDIKTLLTELDQQYDNTTADGQELIEAKAIKAIQGNPTLKKRVFNAVKEGSAAALESAIEHPVAKPVIATIKGFIDP